MNNDILQEAINRYIETNYNAIKAQYRALLIEQWYNPATVDEVDDWRQEFCLNDFKEASWLNLYLKHIANIVCVTKKESEEIENDRKTLQEILLSNEKYKELKESEKQKAQEYNDLRSTLEKVAYLNMKMNNIDKWSLQTDNGKISFTLQFHANIIDEKKVIDYLNEKWLHEFTKQTIIKKSVEQLVLSQMWGDPVSGTEIIETTDIRVSI